MNISKIARAFSTIGPQSQIRFEDRISHLYLEYCKVRQDEAGVIALRLGDSGELIKEHIQLPVGSLGVLILGPGTSISSAAMTSCARSGVSVLVTGGNGYPLYTAGTPLTSGSKWAEAQAFLVTNEKSKRAAARKLYEQQLGVTFPFNVSIAKMRGLEGTFMRNLYKTLSSSAGVKFKRDTTGEDPANVSLNIGNSVLYGLAGSVCATLGLSPSLGIIHRGNVKSFLLDVADVYKPRVTIPIAFQAHLHEDPIQFTRRAVRKEIEAQGLMEQMLKLVMDVLEPHIQTNNNTDQLILGATEVDIVPGHTNYGREVG